MFRGPKVSVIIPTYNSERTIADCINSVLSQDYSNIECIVVNDASTDRTFEILKTYPIRVINLEQNMGPSFARNIGVNEAKGNFIAFIDADCIAPIDWVTNFINNYEEENICGITGPYIDSADDNALSATVDAFIKHAQEEHSEFINNCITSNAFIKREDFLKAGGFPLYQYPWENKYRHGNEDGELAYILIKKYQKPFLWLKDNGVKHYHRATYIKHFKQQRFLAEALLVSLLYFPGSLIMSWRSIFTIQRLLILILSPAIFYILLQRPYSVFLILLLPLFLMIFYFYKKRYNQKIKLLPLFIYPFLSALAWIIGGIEGGIKFLLSLPFWLLKDGKVKIND